MNKKVRCENCDAVIEVEEKRFYMSMKWHYECRCYHCNSVRTVETNEPYRLPKWERGLTPRAVDLPSAVVNNCNPVNGVHASWCTGHETANH